jgi:hypothetical protein
MRFAQVTLSKVGTEDATPLVTDARGRMRYRLPAGEYRLSLPAARTHNLPCTIAVGQRSAFN